MILSAATNLKIVRYHMSALVSQSSREARLLLTRKPRCRQGLTVEILPYLYCFRSVSIDRHSGTALKQPFDYELYEHLPKAYLDDWFYYKSQLYLTIRFCGVVTETFCVWAVVLALMLGILRHDNILGDDTSMCKSGLRDWYSFW